MSNENLVEKVNSMLWIPDDKIIYAERRNKGMYYSYDGIKFSFVYLHVNYKYLEDDSRSQLSLIGIVDLPTNRSVRKFDGNSFKIGVQNHFVYKCPEHNQYFYCTKISKYSCPICLSNDRSILSKKAHNTQIERYGKEAVSIYFDNNPLSYKNSKKAVANMSQEERTESFGKGKVKNFENARDLFLEKYAIGKEYHCISNKYKGFWDNNEKRIMYKFVHSTCNTTFKASLDRISCPTCNPPYFKSEEEIRSLTGGSRLRIKKGNTSHYEIDSYIEDKKLGFEYNGVTFHSSNHSTYAISYNKHQQKSLFMAGHGVKLVHVWEDIWITKRDIVMSFMNNQLGKSTKIYARKCVIKAVSPKEALEFQNNTHMQGGKYSKVNLGLFLDNELVSVLSINTHPKYQWEIDRFSTKLGYYVVGGFSKLLKYFESTYKPNSLFTYADIDLNNIPENSVYYKSGFTFMGITPPSYWYINPKTMTRHSRHSMQKHKLKERFPDIYTDEKTETQIMTEAKYLKCHDSGNFKFIKEYTWENNI